MKNGENVEKNEVKNSLMSQEEFVTNVLNYYKTNDITPGDPNEGRWEECHYPIPATLGGTETILLLEEHHAVQGVLQSEEFGVRCFYPNRKTLDFINSCGLRELATKWMSLTLTRNLETFRRNNPERARELSLKAGLQNQKRCGRQLEINNVVYPSIRSAARSLTNGNRRTLFRRYTVTYL